MQIFGPIDINLNQAIELGLERLPDFPPVDDAKLGRVFFHLGNSTAYLCIREYDPLNPTTTPNWKNIGGGAEISDTEVTLFKTWSSSWSAETSFTTISDFSIGNVLLTTFGTTTPFFNVYKQNGDDWSTPLSTPAILPSVTYGANAVAVSPDSNLIVLGPNYYSASNQILYLYRRTGPNINYVSTITMANSQYRTVSNMMFSPDGQYLAVGLYGGNATGNYYVLYQVNPDYSLTLKYSQSSSVAYNARGISWKHDSSAVCFFGGPDIIKILKNNAGTFTALPPSAFNILPAACPAPIAYKDFRGAAYSPDGTILVLALNVAPFIQVYTVSGDTYTQLNVTTAFNNDNPRSMPYSFAWSADSQFLYVVGANGINPYIASADGGQAIVYRRNGNIFEISELSFGGTEANTAYVASVSPDNKYVAVGTGTTPFLTLWKTNKVGKIKLTGPTLPGVNGDVQFDKSALYNSATNVTPTDDMSGLFIATGFTVSPYNGLVKFNGASFDVLTSNFSGVGASNGTIEFLPDSNTILYPTYAGSLMAEGTTFYQNQLYKLFKLYLGAGYSINNIALSPNGQYVAFQSYNSVLTTHLVICKITVNGGLSKVYTLPMNVADNIGVWGITWTADSKYLISYSPENSATDMITVVYNNNGVFSVVPNGFDVILTSKFTANSSKIACSPTGNFLAVALPSAPYLAIYVIGGTEGSPTFTRLAAGNISPAPAAAVNSVFWSENSDTLYVTGANGVFSGFHAIAYSVSGNSFTRIASSVFGAGAYAANIGSSKEYNGTRYVAFGTASTPFIEIYTDVSGVFTKLTAPTLPTTCQNAKLIVS